MFGLNRKVSLHVLQKKVCPYSSSGFNINIERLHSDYEQVCIFDSNKSHNNSKHTTLSRMIAIGATREITLKNEKNIFEKLEAFLAAKKTWLFGYITYDLKNETETLTSENDDHLHFPLLHFFSPKVVLQINSTEIVSIFDTDLTSEEEANSILEIALSENKNNTAPTKATIKSRITKEEYITSFNAIKEHIQSGDIYEINLCQEFFAENAFISPPSIYTNLNSISKAPFSAFCRFGGHYLISSSPERYLQKKGNALVSQPIKGTIKRAEDPEEDEHLKQQLRNSTKEQNENVMIVDLVRNDLSRIAKRGTVKVDELFEVYSFKQVHQLISSVSCELKENISFTDILKATFPMGSMTGAPKVSAMKLIEKYEQTKRGLYSGALGYITPEGDFDFSVVIRSILYNASNQYLSFMVGSAITAKANAEQEYEECLLKAKAMFEVLSPAASKSKP